MSYELNDRGVFRRYMADDGGNDEMEHYFPPLEQVVLPIPREKYPHGGGISQQGPEEDEDEGFMRDMGPGSPQSAYDEPVGGLPPPTEPLFENDVDMEAFRGAVEQAGVKEFFQQVCADILLQRPDDVFRFTARKLRAEARSAHSRRVVEEQLADQMRAEELKKLALEEQQRKIEEMMNSRSPKRPENPAITLNGKASVIRKRHFVGRGGGGGPARPLTPLTQWSKRRMVGIALSPPKLIDLFLAHYRITAIEAKTLFALCRSATVDGRTVGTSSFTTAVTNTKIGYVGSSGRMDDSVAMRLFKCLAWQTKLAGEGIETNILQCCSALVMLDITRPFGERCETVRSFAQRGCHRQYRLSRNEVQRLLWCIFVPAQRACVALHLHQSQKSPTSSRPGARSIVWNKLSSMYSSDLEGTIDMVRGVVQHIFNSKAVDVDDVIDNETRKPIPTIGFDQLLKEVCCGDTWSTAWSKRCWTSIHIDLVNNEYKAPETPEFFDGEKLWKVAGESWTEQTAGDPDGITQAWRDAIDAALYQMREEITATWVRLFIGSSEGQIISPQGASEQLVPQQQIEPAVSRSGAKALHNQQRHNRKQHALDMEKALRNHENKKEAEAAATENALRVAEEKERLAEEDPESSSSYDSSGDGESGRSESGSESRSESESGSSYYSRESYHSSDFYSGAESENSHISDDSDFYYNEEHSFLDLKAEQEADGILDAVEEHLSRMHPKGRDAAQYLVEVFHGADDNDDGVLEVDELSRAFEIIGYPLTPRQLNLVLCVLDHDMTGVVRSEEFSTILLNSMRFQAAVGKVQKKLMFCRGLQNTIKFIKKKTKTQEAAERAVRIFKHFDVDVSGALEFEEFKKSIAFMGMKLPDDKLQKLMILLDADNTGRVELAEFLQVLGHKLPEKKEEEEEVKVELKVENSENSDKETTMANAEGSVPDAGYAGEVEEQDEQDTAWMQETLQKKKKKKKSGKEKKVQKQEKKKNKNKKNKKSKSKSKKTRQNKKNRLPPRPLFEGTSQEHNAAINIQRVQRGNRIRILGIGDPRKQRSAIMLQAVARKRTAKMRVQQIHALGLSPHENDSLVEIFSTVDARNIGMVEKMVWFRKLKCYVDNDTAGEAQLLMLLLDAKDLPPITRAIVMAPTTFPKAFLELDTINEGIVTIEELFLFAFSRIDDDGRAYSMQQFAKYYGSNGKVKWENAHPIVEPHLLVSESDVKYEKVANVDNIVEEPAEESKEPEESKVPEESKEPAELAKSRTTDNVIDANLVQAADVVQIEESENVEVEDVQVRCIAVHEFVPQTEDDLGFDADDVIIATDTSDDWWYGYLEVSGVESFHGQFPSNYVKVQGDVSIPAAETTVHVEPGEEEGSSTIVS
jgi:Ca2+-binding EF-hand superfamily protein